MSYDDFESEGIRINGDPATPETLEMLDELARGFIREAPVVCTRSFMLTLEDAGTVVFQQISETETGDTTELSTETLRVYIEDEDEKPICELQLSEDQGDECMLEDGSNPDQLLDAVNAFLMSGKLSDDEISSLTYFKVFGLTLAGKLMTRDIPGYNRAIDDMYQKTKRAIEAKSMFSVFNMQNSLPTTEGEVEVSSYWVIPDNRNDEATELAAVAEHNLPSLSVRLTDFTTDYGHEVINAMNGGMLRWSMFPINPMTQELSAEDVHAHPEILEALDVDDTPGETDVQSMINALIEAEISLETS